MRVNGLIAHLTNGQIEETNKDVDLGNHERSFKELIDQFINLSIGVDGFEQVDVKQLKKEGLDLDDFKYRAFNNELEDELDIDEEGLELPILYTMPLPLTEQKHIFNLVMKVDRETEEINQLRMIDPDEQMTQQRIDLKSTQTLTKFDQINAINLIDQEHQHHLFEKVFPNQKTAGLNIQTAPTRDVLNRIGEIVSETNRSDKQNKATFGQLFNGQRTTLPIEQLQTQLGARLTEEQALSQTLMAKFESAINESQFLQKITGEKQLILQLSPRSLDKITIEITKVDGEMFVKLSARSEATKQALEANSKELRQLFSPHNILIEKLEHEPIVVEHHVPQEQLHDERETPDKNNQPIFDEQEEKENTVQFADILWQERI